MEGGAKPGPPGGEERRHNLELRERLDEIIHLARRLSRDASSLSPRALDDIRTRIEWLAEEVWQSATYGPLEERSRPNGESGGDR